MFEFVEAELERIETWAPFYPFRICQQYGSLPVRPSCPLPPLSRGRCTHFLPQVIWFFHLIFFLSSQFSIYIYFLPIFLLPSLLPSVFIVGTIKPPQKCLWNEWIHLPLSRQSLLVSFPVSFSSSVSSFLPPFLPSFFIFCYFLKIESLLLMHYWIFKKHTDVVSVIFGPRPASYFLMFVPEIIFYPFASSFLSPSCL